MKHRQIVLLCSLVFLGVSTLQLRAQPVHEEVSSVIRSAVDTVFSSLSITVGSGEIVHVDLSALRANVDRASVAERLSLDQARRADVFRCPHIEGTRPDRNCFIEGADYLITIHSLSMSDDTASVEIELQGEGEGDDYRGHYRSVWSGGWLILLDRAEGGWFITEVKHLWET